MTMTGNYYASLYADLIRKGRKTLDDVPERLRKAVQAILEGTADA